MKHTVNLGKRPVLLVTDDSEFASVLGYQISHFGYSIQVVRDLHSLEDAVAQDHPQAVLVDMPSLQPGLSDGELAVAFQGLKIYPLPVIFFSDRAGQSTRLTALRAGGIAFLPKPVNMIALVDKLDDYDVTQENEPYRVLIVEDQAPVANYYQMILQTAGMQARVVLDSTHFLESMLEFRPDLILMDLYMPVVDGAELARLVRQMDEFVSIPIVFLSSEADFTRHIEILDLGSDDFLTKPIKATHLVALVKSRLERLKILRGYIVRDSLTGLLNHTSFREVLEQEVNRCQRQSSTVALAMLDIDHFKRVNDTFGHAVGSSVVKCLSRLLRQRLRKCDIIGRYGGDEFVALFLDADPEQAFRVIEQLRVHLADMEFGPAPEKKLSVAFSAGIASFPAFPTAKKLSDAADEAMYLAKKAGRNRTVIASPDPVRVK